MKQNDHLHSSLTAGNIERKSTIVDRTIASESRPKLDTILPPTQNIDKDSDGIASPAITTDSPAAHRTRTTARTPGERTFDLLNYYGLGWIVNATLGMVITDTVMQKHKPKFLDTVDVAAKTIFRYAKNPKALSYRVLELAVMMSGGTLVLAPMKIMEDNKANIVEGLDRKFFYGDRVDTDPTLRLTYQEIEHQPTAGWINLLTSRVIGMFGVWNTAAAIGDRSSPIPRTLGTPGVSEVVMDAARKADKIMNKNNPALIARIEAAERHSAREAEAFHRGASESELRYFKENAPKDTLSTRALYLGGMDYSYSALMATIIMVSSKVLNTIGLGKEHTEKGAHDLAAETAMRPPTSARSNATAAASDTPTIVDNILGQAPLGMLKVDKPSTHISHTVAHGRTEATTELTQQVTT